MSSSLRPSSAMRMAERMGRSNDTPVEQEDRRAAAHYWNDMPDPSNGDRRPTVDPFRFDLRRALRQIVAAFSASTR